MPLSSKEMVALLKKRGYMVVGQTGSHLKLRHPGTRVTVIVPVHSKDLKKGTEAKIFKDAGIKGDRK